MVPHDQAGENCIPGMIDRTIYVGSNLQVMVRLANGGLLQASVPNDGVDLGSHEQGRAGQRPRAARRASDPCRRAASLPAT